MYIKMNFLFKDQPSSFLTTSPTGIEQLDVIVTGDYRQSGHVHESEQRRPNVMTTGAL